MAILASVTSGEAASSTTCGVGVILAEELTAEFALANVVANLLSDDALAADDVVAADVVTTWAELADGLKEVVWLVEVV